MIRKNKAKLEQLKWFDILILTLIFWGDSIRSSTEIYLQLLSGSGSLSDYNDFSEADNYSALLYQLIFLAAAALYLRLRRFNFSRWNIRFNFKALAAGGLIFVGAALLIDAYTFATAGLAEQLPFPEPLAAFFDDQNVSTVIYSLFNGFYEEIYFLGLCLAVSPRQLRWVLPFSLLVRVSFHTYQGMLAALGIGLVFGLYMFLLYRRSKEKNLLPFFLAHALADIFGLSLLWHFGIYL